MTAEAGQTSTKNFIVNNKLNNDTLRIANKNLATFTIPFDREEGNHLTRSASTGEEQSQQHRHKVLAARLVKKSFQEHKETRPSAVELSRQGVTAFRKDLLGISSSRQGLKQRHLQRNINRIATRHRRLHTRSSMSSESVDVSAAKAVDTIVATPEQQSADLSSGKIPRLGLASHYLSRW